MESARFRVAIPQPCCSCNATELKVLQEAFENSEDDVWYYHVEIRCACNRCARPSVNATTRYDVMVLGSAAILLMLILGKYLLAGVAVAAGAYWYFRPRDSQRYVQVPIGASTVGVVERAIHASSVAEKGTAFRAHATFVHHLSNLDLPEVQKQALVVWAPAAMMGFMDERAGVTRTLAVGHPLVCTDSPASSTSGPGAKTSATINPAEQLTFCGNPDVQDGAMLGTSLKGDEYGKETRVAGGGSEADPKVLARQIGPDLIPTEVFQSTEGNLKAGLAKRVKPLPFLANKKLTRRVDQTVTALITKVFTKQKIHEWRESNPLVGEMHSKKWSSTRFRNAFEEVLSDTTARIEQEFQVKTNEALPAKDKAPRPIIQTGDKGQILMQLPVKCFEDILFSFFESASIKHTDKHSAMARVAKHLRMKGAKVLESDGSAWDACCNERIRAMTENRIIEHIIEMLGDDAEVPHGWMRKCLADMKKKQLKGKAKVDNKKTCCPLRVLIDAIRQSGHRGTSAFNFLINLVCWIAILCVNPANMIVKTKRNELECWYQSVVDGEWYCLKYAFEGDDSAIATTEDLDTDYVEDAWTSLGFRMKLKFAKDFFTFTGFDFLLDENGPTGDFCPEIPRNIASSSWTCSSEAKSRPERINFIGAAAMLSRAENFRDCGPMSRYFAELGLAHVKQAGDFSLGENEAIQLGICPCKSVRDRLHELSAGADVLSKGMRKLCDASFGGFTKLQEAELLSCTFDDPCDVSARYLIPRGLWDPAAFKLARR